MWYRETKVTSTRKPHRCAGCRKMISAGMPALYISCCNEGDDPFFGYYHDECRAAEIGLNAVRDFQPGDDWCPLHEAEPEDLEWLETAHPIVFARLLRLAA